MYIVNFCWYVSILTPSGKVMEAVYNCRSCSQTLLIDGTRMSFPRHRFRLPRFSTILRIERFHICSQQLMIHISRRMHGQSNLEVVASRHVTNSTASVRADPIFVPNRKKF